MEVSENVSSEVVSSPEVVSESSTPVETSSSASSDTGKPDGAPVSPVVPEEWKPNFKVKAYDKEFEIPEKMRGFINKENEKDFRDAYEKAYALDVIKEKNQKIRADNERYQQAIEKDFAPKLQRYEKIESYLQKKDYDSFFEKAGIPEKELQAWMLKRLQLRDLPPEQQALYTDQRAAQQRAYQLEEENQKYKQELARHSESQQQAVVNEQLGQLDKAINSPEVAQIAKSFDERLGQANAFKIEVLRRASVIAKTTGRELTVEEAVGDFLKVLGQSNPSAVSSPQVQAAAKPTLPGLAGKATSPASQKIKSFDDLKKIAKASMAQASRASRE